MKYISLKNIKKQKGFSILELLIAVSIGLFLIAGIATSYATSKGSSIKKDQFSALEDNGRIALEVITRVIEHAGYSPGGGTISPFITAPSDVTIDTCSDGTQNVIDASIFSATADNSAGDVLGIIHHSDDNIFTDCTGDPLPPSCRLTAIPGVNPIPDASKIYNSFFRNSVTDNLECAGSRNGSREIIAEGIENIQFLYGIDTIDDSEVKVDRYVNATNIGGQWNDVVSIQVAILVRSLKAVKHEAESTQYTLLDHVVTTNTDRFQRAVFSTTVHIRNTL